VTRTLLHRGGTVASTSGSLRALLDAALSSPSGRGVVADDDGRLVGTIRAAEVIPAIEARRDAAPAEGATAR
jgi:osmoprotectant transport system ATP-binding protein